jgi:hypothetical protein
MNVIDWLNREESEFAALSVEERATIADFALLWTCFESKLLATEGNPKNILALAERVVEAGGIPAERFTPILACFRNRYVNDGSFTHHFENLHFGKSDYQSVVKKALLGTTDDRNDLLYASLLIVFRYRNNLFHGNKWAQGVRDQQGNFQKAIELMQAVMEVHPAAV